MTEIQSYWTEKLKTDIRHCKLDEAESLCDCFRLDAYYYIHENEDLEDDFQAENMLEAEYLWRYCWDEFIDFMRNKYTN